MEEKFMREALKEAKKAFALDEVPIGAVVVKDGRIIARAHNQKEQKQNATQHAEIVAIGKASKKLKNWYLDGCEMYVTLEPCAMCAGALINARLDRLYFAAWEPKSGCCGSVYNLPADKSFNHTLEVAGGIMAEESQRLLSDFFKLKRGK